MLEDDDDILEQTNDLTIFPPQGEITDEDSGDENVVGLNNLPASQIQVPAEINVMPKPYNDDDFSSEDELPLSRLIPPIAILAPNTSNSLKSPPRAADAYVLGPDLIQTASGYPVHNFSESISPVGNQEAAGCPSLGDPFHQ
ncbi:hypothetical protein D910_11880 [Dendroctonus ponderosae]